VDQLDLIEYQITHLASNASRERKKMKKMLIQRRRIEREPEVQK